MSGGDGAGQGLPRPGPGASGGVAGGPRMTTAVRFALPAWHLWPPAFAVAVPFVLGVALMPWFIGRLSRAGMGQRIREEGPKGHLAKAGTPTAGGLLVIALILLTALLMDRSRAIQPVLGALVLGGAFGFLDDMA